MIESVSLVLRTWKGQEELSALWFDGARNNLCLSYAQSLNHRGKRMLQCEPFTLGRPTDLWVARSTWLITLVFVRRLCSEGPVKVYAVLTTPSTAF